MHERVIRTLDCTTGAIAGDSTGYSESRFEKWVDFRMDETRNRHGWIKLHAIIDVEFRIILTYNVTSSHTADIKGMDDILKDLLDIDYSLERRDFCLDKAYLSRDMCNKVSEMGMTPFIKPKSNTVHNAKGSQSWREMIDMCKNDPTAFDDRYHQRSIIERIRSYQNYVRQLRQVPQARQSEAVNLIRTICYNIELIARSCKKRQAHAPVA